jgi:hypothetical protein
LKFYQASRLNCLNPFWEDEHNRGSLRESVFLLYRKYTRKFLEGPENVGSLKIVDAAASTLSPPRPATPEFPKARF